MKHPNTFVILFVLLFTANSLCGQSIGINTLIPDSTAILDISSDTKGLLIPRMSTAERLSIGAGSPAVGLMVYDNTTNSFWFWNGVSWGEIGAGSADTDWVETPNEVYTTKNAAIGLTSAERKLDVGGTGAQYIRVRSTNGTTNGMEFMRQGAGTDWRLNNASGFFDISSSADEFTSNTIHATITNSGQLGVGVLTPARVLDVGGEGVQYMRVRSTNGTTNGIEFMRQGTGTDWRFLNANGFFDISSSTDEFATTTVHASFTSSGRLGIGTLSPLTELHVNGGIRSNDLAGTGNRPVLANSSGDLIAGGSATTQYWITSGYGFDSTHPNFNDGSIAYIFSTTSSQRIHAPVHLPNGANVTSVYANYGDGSAITNVRIRLVRLANPGLNTDATLSEIISAGTPGANVQFTDNSIASPVIDNINYSYVIWVEPTGLWDNNLINIRNVRIEYTMP